MMPKLKTKNLSTRYFLLHKYGFLGILILLFLIILTVIIYRWTHDRILIPWVTPAIISFVAILNWLRLHKKVLRLEYDADFLYVFQKQQDIVIPLENIKEVYISEKGGMFEIDFYNPESFGRKLHFKPSLFYPIGFNKAEGRVREFQKSIKLAKQKVPFIQKNALHS